MRSSGIHPKMIFIWILNISVVFEINIFGSDCDGCGDGDGDGVGDGNDDDNNDDDGGRQIDMSCRKTKKQKQKKLARMRVSFS